MRKEYLFKNSKHFLEIKSLSLSTVQQHLQQQQDNQPFLVIGLAGDVESLSMSLWPLEETPAVFFPTLSLGTKLRPSDLCCDLPHFLRLSSLIMRNKSKNALSTFSLVFADVSIKGTPQFFALFSPTERDTFRLSSRSDLFPIKINGMRSSLSLTRIIWSLQD